MDLFAATPPLECKKMLFSMAVTEGIGYQRGKRNQGKVLDFIDVRRAYFHAPARRDVQIELPEEDWEEGMCGKLDKSMYGTRDAAQNWEEEYSEFMLSIGFRRGLASPCVFYHQASQRRDNRSDSASGIISFTASLGDATADANDTGTIGRQERALCFFLWHRSWLVGLR